MLRVTGLIKFSPVFSNSLMESNGKCENRRKQYVTQMTSNHTKSGQKKNRNSNLKQHRHKVSRFYLELFHICSNFSGICFIPILTLIFCQFGNICGTWNRLIHELHALHVPFAWAACGFDF